MYRFNGNNNAIEFKVEKVDDGTLIEIDDSDDDQYSGMQAAFDLTNNQTEVIKSNGSLEQTNQSNRNVDNANYDNENVVKIKVEPIATNEYESVEIPLAEFDPNKERGTNQTGECTKAPQETLSLNTVSNESSGIGGKRFKCKPRCQCTSESTAKSQRRRQCRVDSYEKLLGVKADSNGLYHCTHCIRRFTKVHQLRKHMQMHKNGQYLHYCAHCMRSFARLAHKYEHES